MNSKKIILTNLIAAITWVFPMASSAYVTGQIYQGKNDFNFGFMHTEQNCSINENQVLHKKTFCTNSDMKQSTEDSKMVEAIKTMLDKTLLQSTQEPKVTIAYLSFSNKEIQRKICELSRKEVPVRIFLDGGSKGQIDDLVLNNPECLDKSSKLNVKLTYLGGSTQIGEGGIWRLHHNKFMLVDLGPSQKSILNFSSGNLSSFGTSLHLDHWVTIEAPKESNLLKTHFCLIDGLESATKTLEKIKNLKPNEADYQITNSYIQTRENCFSKNKVLPRSNNGSASGQITSALNKEEIAALFSPNNDSYVEKSFIESINKIPSNGYLYIAIQHFLHSGVANALINASKRGVDIRIVMDDDVLRGDSEIPGVDKLIENLHVKAPKVQVRFAETNHAAGGLGAMMHNKLAILNGNLTFSGAGHYTYAALRKNWENFYYISNKGIISEYLKYFSDLWYNSVDEDYVKSGGNNKSSDPEKLNF